MDARAAGTQMLRIDGGEWPLDLRVHPRARRITLRLDRKSGRPQLTLPPGVSAAQGLSFAARHGDWLRSRLAELPARVPFADGARLPIGGEPHVVRHVPGARRGVWRAGGEVCVSGRPEHLPRRLADYLKAEARAAIVPRARAKAAAIGRAPRRVVLRDTVSRWGSCSTRGDLGFSWRLVLAPWAVLDYVVAHEVAHLEHMHHGPRFWALVAHLTPEVAGPRRWLRKHGAALLRYG